MSSTIFRSFCVHSKQRPLQNELYDGLNFLLGGVDFKLTHYDEWNWETTNGYSDSEIKTAKQDYERARSRSIEKERMGTVNLEGFGEITFHDRNDLAVFTTIFKRRQVPFPSILTGDMALNRPDLIRLLEESTCCLLVEDEKQSQLSRGMLIEVELLKAMKQKLLYVRIGDPTTSNVWCEIERS